MLGARIDDDTVAVHPVRARQPQAGAAQARLAGRGPRRATSTARRTRSSSTRTAGRCAPTSARRPSRSGTAAPGSWCCPAAPARRSSARPRWPQAQATTLILVTNTVSARQWKDELLRRTSLTEDEIGEYSGAGKEIRPVTIATYQVMTTKPEGRLPPPRAARRPRLGPDRLRRGAPAARADLPDDRRPAGPPPPRADRHAGARGRPRGRRLLADRPQALRRAVEGHRGPGLDRAGRLRRGPGDAARVASGWPTRRPSPRSATGSPSCTPRKTRVVERPRRAAPGRADAGDRPVPRPARRARPSDLDAPVIKGETPVKERQRLFEAFRTGEIDAAGGLQGRQLLHRPARGRGRDPGVRLVRLAPGGGPAPRPAAAPQGRRPHRALLRVVSRDTVDADFAQNRQRFLAEQGYAYRIVDADDIFMGNLDERCGRSASRRGNGAVRSVVDLVTRQVRRSTVPPAAAGGRRTCGCRQHQNDAGSTASCCSTAGPAAIPERQQVSGQVGGDPPPDRVVGRNSRKATVGEHVVQVVDERHQRLARPGAVDPTVRQHDAVGSPPLVLFLCRASGASGITKGSASGSSSAHSLQPSCSSSKYPWIASPSVSPWTVPSISSTSGSEASASAQSGWVPTNQTSPTSRTHARSVSGMPPNCSSSQSACSPAVAVGGACGRHRRPSPVVGVEAVARGREAAYELLHVVPCAAGHLVAHLARGCEQIRRADVRADLAHLLPDRRSVAGGVPRRPFHGVHGPMMQRGRARRLAFAGTLCGHSGWMVPWPDFLVRLGVALLVAAVAVGVIHVVVRLLARRWSWGGDLLRKTSIPFRLTVASATVLGVVANARPEDVAEGGWDALVLVLRLLTIGVGAWFLAAALIFVEDLGLSRYDTGVADNRLATAGQDAGPDHQAAHRRDRRGRRPGGGALQLPDRAHRRHQPVRVRRHLRHRRGSRRRARSPTSSPACSWPSPTRSGSTTSSSSRGSGAGSRRSR